MATYIALTSREASGTTLVEFNDVDENEEVGFRSDSRLPGNCSGSNSADWETDADVDSGAGFMNLQRALSARCCTLRMSSFGMASWSVFSTLCSSSFEHTTRAGAPTPGLLPAAAAATAAVVLSCGSWLRLEATGSICLVASGTLATTVGCCECGRCGEGGAMGDGQVVCSL